MLALAFPLSAIILGVINIGIIVAVLILIGLVIVWICSMFSFAIPQQLQKIYVIIVVLVALYMLVSLLFGIPIPGPLSPGRM